MSITITCQFQHPYQAQQAAQRLRRRGFTVSEKPAASSPTPGNLLVAYPYGTAGGNTFGNGLMGALPPMAENGILTGGRQPRENTILSVLTDDTQTRDARLLLESLGGKIL